ncbi:MAG: Transcriptional regulator [Clostridiales bacterium 38_11]|nr:MAG: Transcriptional regulator [Clostridiales bacterium 38_11]
MVLIKRYKKGIETRNNIINASKSLFYLQGYNNTTVQKIADLASVNLGLLSYYFKTKNNIIKIIFADFFENLDNIVCDVCNKEEDLILFYMIKERVAYDIIFNNPNNLRFFKETINELVVVKIMEDYSLNNFIAINKKNGYNIDINLVKCYSLLENGGSVNIIKKYFSDELIISYEDMVNVLIGCTPRLFGIDNDAINKYVLRTKSLQKDINTSRVKLLI